MSKIVRGYFYINTGYSNCSKTENFEVIFDDNDTEEIIQDALDNHFNDFLGNMDMGWVINEEENE